MTVSIADRICSLPPAAELALRWEKLRAIMCERDVEALVVQGTHGFSGGGGYFQWVTGTIAPTAYSQIAILPSAGLMTLIHHGDMGGEATLDGTSPAHPGVGHRLTTAVFPSAWYMGHYEAELAARAIRQGGYKTIGLVGPNMMHHAFVAGLTRGIGTAAVVDFTEPVDQIKAIKSPYDIECLRRSAAMQDEIIERAKSHIRPGMKDFEALAFGHYQGQLLGSQQGYFLGSSAPSDQPAMQLLRPMQGRTIGEDDILMFQCENAGPDGFYVHLARPMTFGKAPQKLVDALGAAVEAQDFTLSLLHPGIRAADLLAEYNVYLRARGYPPERRLHCHGQGYEPVERPLVREEETMLIAADMNIGMHPVVVHDGISMLLTDNFLTASEGNAERLHKTPRKLIEL